MFAATTFDDLATWLVSLTLTRRDERQTISDTRTKEIGSPSNRNRPKTKRTNLAGVHVGFLH